MFAEFCERLVFWVALFVVLVLMICRLLRDLRLLQLGLCFGVGVLRDFSYSCFELCVLMICLLVF